MATQRLGLIMHGVTGRMGMNQPGPWPLRRAAPFQRSQRARLTSDL